MNDCTTNIPDELVAEALHCWEVDSDARDLEGALRDVLQAVLPKVGGRLIEGDVIREAALANCPDEQRWEKKQHSYEADAHMAVTAAFDAAFPRNKSGS